MDERIARLATFGGSDNDARRTASLMIRMVWRDDKLVQLTPWDLEDSIDQIIVFLGRFMHQSADVLERREMSQLHRWHAITMELLLAQHGKTPTEE